jgi:hypothetical protein
VSRQERDLLLSRDEAASTPILKRDILVASAAGRSRMPAGPNGTLLSPDDTTPSGYSWVPAGAGDGSFGSVSYSGGDLPTGLYKLLVGGADDGVYLVVKDTETFGLGTVSGLQSGVGVFVIRVADVDTIQVSGDGSHNWVFAGDGRLAAPADVVFGGGDIGPVLTDQADGTKRRLVSNAGVLSTEPAG